MVNIPVPDPWSSRWGTARAGQLRKRSLPFGADCTRRGMCVDICPVWALKFDIEGLGKHFVA